MARLHEHQGKALLQQHKLAIPKGGVIKDVVILEGKIIEGIKKEKPETKKGK